MVVLIVVFMFLVCLMVHFSRVFWGFFIVLYGTSVIFTLDDVDMLQVISNDRATTEINTMTHHDAPPISRNAGATRGSRISASVCCLQFESIV